jgi:hypothetical protein
VIYGEARQGKISGKTWKLLQKRRASWERKDLKSQTGAPNFQSRREDSVEIRVKRINVFGVLRLSLKGRICHTDEKYQRI